MANKSKALQLLQIPKSTFYYQSVKDEKNMELRDRIEKVMSDNPSYGHRRIAWQLKINKKRIKRVMKKFGLKPAQGRKKPRKSKPEAGLEASPNLLVGGLPWFKNHIWATDFTYIKWRGRFVYLCTVIDLFSREVLGVSVKTNHSALLVAEALLNAAQSNPPPAIIHSDQGSEYKSKLFRSILKDFKIMQSMSKRGSPWQNAFQESFYGNFKVDIGDVNRFSPLGELTAEIYKSIYYYNNERIHTAFKMAPAEFARQFKVEYDLNQEQLAVQ